MRLSRAYSRHGALTGQSAQMRRAISTPTPSLGKKTEGGMSWHLPAVIHSVSISPPFLPQRWRGRIGSCFVISREGDYVADESRDGAQVTWETTTPPARR